MKEIGGFFPFELNFNKEYYSAAIKLNSGRNALWYILKAYKPKKVYIPFYICDSVLEPIKKLNVNFEFYKIDKNFEPLLGAKLKNREFFLYVNYFGIKDTLVHNLSNKIENLITDNSQAFYCKPFKSPTFYSPRKFFGIPDGAYLFTDKFLKLELKRDISYEKSIYLLKKFDLDSHKGYLDYKKAEKSFSVETIKQMSKLTQNILSSIDYEKIKLIREQNFKYLHKKLKNINELEINNNNLNGPMKYPLLIKNEKLKNYLIQNKIYASTYWSEVLSRVDKSSIESFLTKYLVPLPIDQRYNKRDMNVIIEKINEILYV